ncbi:MAG: tRNA threonylcarbamoyladenosine dehydratase [Bacillota bacterium]
MENRFSRTEMLIGKGGLKILVSSRVAVFGLGGVGSYAVEALARAGIGGFTLVDFDIITVSNINRQLHALEDTLGMAKVDLMRDRIKKINPRAEITAYKERYAGEQREKFFAEPPDYVVDAIDDLEGKVDLIKHCLSGGIPVVSSMGAGNKMDPTLFKVDDISATSVCPLARAVRRRLRQEGVTTGVKVVFSTEEPCRPDGAPEAGTKKFVPGSISFVPPVAGMILAGVVVRDLLKGTTPGQN